MRGSPQTKQSRKTARRKSRQLARIMSAMLATAKNNLRASLPTIRRVNDTETNPLAAILAGLGSASTSTIRRI